LNSFQSFSRFPSNCDLFLDTHSVYWEVSHFFFMFPMSLNSCLHSWWNTWFVLFYGEAFMGKDCFHSDGM
jgi:hypothetical protein